MATPAQTPKLDANKKAMLLLAVTQLDQLAVAFGEAPERVKNAAEEFKAALKEWASNA